MRVVASMDGADYVCERGHHTRGVVSVEATDAEGEVHNSGALCGVCLSAYLRTRFTTYKVSDPPTKV